MFRPWCEQMLKTYTGRAALSNLQHDLAHGRLPFSVFQEFASRLLLRLSTFTSSAPYLVAEISRADPTTFLCQGSPPIDKVPNCSTIMLALDFIEQNVDLHRFGWSFSGYVPQEHIGELERGIGAENLRASIPATRPIGWVTKTSDVQRLRETCGDSLASELHQKLGLLHFTNEHQFVEIVYPRNAFSKGGLAPPTFLDGAPCLVYRSAVRGDGWGRAVDLASGTEGLPEAVHRPIPLTDDFRVLGIGSIDSLKVRIDFTDLGRGEHDAVDIDLVVRLFESATS
jgi:hypothetical protein